jgi:F-type H+-transporting ATPase subunit delta
MMRGASAEALAELEESIAKPRTLAEAATTGEQLFALVRILRGEVALRRALTDGAVEGAAKVGLVESIFKKTLEDPTLRIVSNAVQRRWTLSRDLPEALEILGVMALVRSAGKDAERVSDELFDVRQLIDSVPEFRAALSDPKRSTEDRTSLLSKLLEGKALPATVQLVTQASSGERGGLDTALRRFQDIAAEAQGEIIATVHTARELREQDQQRLVAALGKQYDTSVHLHVVVDPDLVGGLRVEIRQDIIDGTVVSKIDEARRRIAG